MDWKVFAKDKLKDYNARKESIIILSDEISELEYRRQSIRSATADGTAVQGGGSKREDMLLNSIVHQDELKENLLIAVNWVKRVEKGLAVLTDEEKTILSRFYIRPERGAAERLSIDLGVDIKTVYHRKDRALRKFTTAMYGCIKS